MGESAEAESLAWLVRELRTGTTNAQAMAAWTIEDEGITRREVMDEYRRQELKVFRAKERRKIIRAVAPAVAAWLWLGGAIGFLWLVTIGVI